VIDTGAHREPGSDAEYTDTAREYEKVPGC
jgi:hypothetical protein